MDIEFHGLKIFCQVMTDKSFSKAARSLRITQPTVSQQIAKLELALQGKLFERVGHDIIPTSLAKELFQFGSPLLESIVDFQERLQDKRTLPKGSVRYAMPESCQWTPHYRKIMQQISEVPEIYFKIDILPNELILKKLIEGHIDFGFVIGERVASELHFQKFSDETYTAAARNKDFFRPFQYLDERNSLRLISYPGWESFFEKWSKSHGIWKNTRQKLNEPSLHIGSLAGAIHALREGAGVGIVPNQCVADDLKMGRLYEWKSQKASSVSNPVYLARRVGENLPKRVSLVIDMLQKSKS